MTSSGNRNHPIDEGLRGTRRTEGGPRQKVAPPPPALAPPVKVHFFNSKKTEGQSTQIEGVKVGFKRTDMVPLAATQPPPAPPETLVKTSEATPFARDNKLSSTAAPRGAELVNRFKVHTKESGDQPPAKLLRKGMAFEADLKILDEPSGAKSGKTQPGPPSSSYQEDSIRATMNSEKPSIEMRPPLNFSAQGKTSGGGAYVPSKDSQPLTRTVAERGQRNDEPRNNDFAGGKPNDLYSSQRQNKQGDRDKDRDRDRDRKGGFRPEFKDRQPANPHPDEHEDRHPKGPKTNDRFPKRGKGLRDKKHDAHGGYQRRGPQEEEYVAREAPNSRKRSEDSSDGGGARVDLGNNIFRVLGRKN